MIKEYYCSYEVSKLLKEKGFECGCRAYYEDGRFCWVWNDGVAHNTEHPRYAACPTQALAMKWLRENGIIIVIDYNGDEDCKESERWGFSTYTNSQRKVGFATFPTYEQAVEAALEYALKNLV